MSTVSRLLADRLTAEFGAETSPSAVEPSAPLTAGALSLSEIFAEQPPLLDEFVRSPDYLGIESGLSPVQFDLVRHFEQILYLDTYELMAEEWDPAWAPVRMVNELVAMWGKGSSAPYTPVYDAKTGQWVRLDEFVESDVAAAYPRDGKITRFSGTDSFREGHGQMFRVTTKSGLVEDVWEGHRYLVRPERFMSTTGRKYYPSTKPDRATKRKGLSHRFVQPQWERLWDIRVGQQIAVATTVPEPAEPLLGVPDHEVELLALFIGDGSCTPGHGAMVCGGSAAVHTRDRLLKIVSEYGWDHREHIRDDGKWTIFPKNFAPHRGKASPFRALLRAYGLENTTAQLKHVPSQIFSLPTRQVALFVSRLIDTDGWLSVSNTAEIGYSTVSRALAEDVRRLMLRLGVPVSVSRKKTTWEHNGVRQTGEAYTVRVRQARFVRILAEQLTLLDKEPARLSVLDRVSAPVRTKGVHGDLAWDEVVSIEPLGEGEYWTLSVDGPACYVSSSGLLSHNSGKDLSIQVGFSRLANILLCMKNPQQYYGLAHNTVIHFLNVAYSSTQAHAAFFKPLRNLFISSPFFKDRFEADPPGPQAIAIRLDNKLELVSGHSDADSLEGKNLLAGVADEISAFPTISVSRSGKPPARNADAIIDMLRSSASTRFPLTHKVAQISYPRTTGDAIQVAMKEAQDDFAEEGDASVFYASGPYRTWDVNPIYANMPKTQLPGMDYEIPSAPRIVRDYKKSRGFAQAKYECLPQDASNAYFKNKQAVEQAFSTPLTIPPLGISYFYAADPAAGEVAKSWQVAFQLQGLVPLPGALYAIHADMAINGDRAGIAMSHVKSYIDIETSDGDGMNARIERRPSVVVDFATAFEYDAEALTEDGEAVEREIQIRWYRKMVLFLVSQGFPILSVSMDGFQSADSLQILAAQGYPVARVSLDRDDTIWKTLQDLIYEGRISGPNHPLLKTEILSLSKQGKKVDHPVHGSKDIADAVAASAAQAILIGGQEEGVDYVDRGTSFSVGAGPGLLDADGFGLFGSSGSDFFMDTNGGSLWQ